MKPPDAEKELLRKWRRAEADRQPGKSVKLELEATFSHLVTPHPTHITQAERQLVLYQGNHYFLSLYPTQSQTTRVTLPSSKIESYSKLKPASQSESTVTYGPYEKVQPLSETVLPASAMDVYYRDEIGNISTSHMKVLDDSVELDIRPRFPLFGGWKTHYVLGYYVPTYEYLYNSGKLLLGLHFKVFFRCDNYVLQMRFVDHIFDDSVIDKASVRIILPEGARDIKLKTPFPVTRLDDRRHYTYLDTVGRPVIVLEKSNLVEQHIQNFEVHYKFKKLLMLQEPLLVVVVLYLLFLLVVIYVRLDFTISKDPAQESKLQVGGLLEKVASLQDRRADVYAQYDAALGKYKASKDSVGYQAAVKRLNGEHKTHTQSLADCLAKLKQEGAEAAEAVSELQRLDKHLKEQFQQQMALLDKLMGGKMSKQQFVEAEAAIQRKKEELADKMHSLTASL
ncbi:hypothetical protein HPB47_026706 [Ixodes persulcatus]|uniref:Uncharacterized protein n=1 Tax=Ixodes persulcatus TaxID=34615 RepID=A0AC60PZ65_IXOPE|nr:hypothetical protein HPB47_026706 [Ixodes persulcatus]